VGARGGCDAASHSTTRLQPMQTSQNAKNATV
jgi:hypothetical protein